MKNQIVSRRALAFLFTTFALFTSATIANAQDHGRTEVYAHYPDSGYTEHIGTVYFNYGTGSHGYTDSWEAAYGFMDRMAQDGNRVYYDGGGSGGCRGSWHCYDEEVVTNPIIVQTLDALLASISSLPVTSVALWDEAYVFDSTHEGYLIGTALYAGLGDTSPGYKRVSHWFSTRAEAANYLQSRANAHAVVIYDPDFINL